MKQIYIFIVLFLCLHLQAQDLIERNTSFTPTSSQKTECCTGVDLKNDFSYKSTTDSSFSINGSTVICSPQAIDIVATSNQNYIVTITPIDEIRTMSQANGVIDIDPIFNSNVSCQTTIQYFDGLGRQNQIIQRGITPEKQDLVVLKEYDALGRESNTWLPAMVSGNNGGYITNISTLKAAAKNTNTNNGTADQNPYSFPVYESSLLSRVVGQYGPGADWQTNHKSIKTEYLTNSGTSGVLSCALFTVEGSSITTKAKKNGFYNDNELYVTKSIDEDGNEAYQFKDKLGQVVLTRQLDGTAQMDTYYVYDNFGNLCFVFPPMVAEILIMTDGSWNHTNATSMAQYGYVYCYDGYNRCIYKKIPGVEPVYYVYDKADRLIFSQDGEQRKNSLWLYSIPDLFGRVVLTGMCKNTINFTTDPLKNVVVRGDFCKITNTYKGYMITGVSLLTPTVLLVNYYDSYDFMGLNSIPTVTDNNFKCDILSDYGKQHTNAKGLLTGTVKAMLEGATPPTYLYSVIYYDYRGRVIQTKSNSHLIGGLEKEYIAYNHINQPTKRQHVHAAQGKSTQTEVYAYTYDHTGRLTATTHQLNDGPTLTLAANTYDDLGRLKTTKRNEQATMESTYGYNVRSWMKAISSPLFKQNLYYNESYGGSTVRYNSNLSAIEWVASEDKTRGYAFVYDNLSRLKNANYLENEIAYNHYNTAYTYDKMGNIKTLQRYGNTTASTYGLIDDLTLSYTGNQLLNVDDGIANFALAESSDFKNYTADVTEYYYNANGAIYKDLNKGISNIQYNYLNLPMIVDIKNPVAEARNEYTYLADGQKLKVIQKYNPDYSKTPVLGSDVTLSALMVTKTTDYVGNMIYENGSLKRILVDGGYIEGDTYYFYLTDHLGNNRIVANASGVIVQKNHYYPFGMPFADTPLAEQGMQPYKYNGKEYDQMHGLNLSDYGARMKADFCFTTIDPLCEKYYDISPYAYCANNPVNMIDPDGRDAIYIAFPKYRANGIPFTGHAGILLIDNKTGLTKYYEYGRYDKEGKGLVRTVSVSNLVIGKDGKPTTESLNKVMKQLSDKSGHGGDIEGAYIISDKFKEMNDYAKGKMSENSDPERKKYSITSNNCATFAEDVITQDKSVDKPSSIINSPINIVNEYQEEGNARVQYKVKTQTTTIGTGDENDAKIKKRIDNEN